MTRGVECIECGSRDVTIGTATVDGRVAFEMDPLGTGIPLHGVLVTIECEGCLAEHEVKFAAPLPGEDGTAALFDISDPEAMVEAHAEGLS